MCGGLLFCVIARVCVLVWLHESVFACFLARLVVHSSMCVCVVVCGCVCVCSVAGVRVCLIDCLVWCLGA